MGVAELELKDAEVLRLQAGDILVVRFTRSLSMADRDRIREQLKELLAEMGIDNQVLIFDGDDTKISILRPDQS